jgi:rhodanese-related sulfurtransferase
MTDLPSVAAADLPPDAVLLDVREPDEWDRGHAPGALHIPMGDIPDRVDEIPEGDVVVTCHLGGRSARVTAWLVGQGRQVRNLDGGMVAYAATGRELVSENGLPPSVE